MKQEKWGIIYNYKAGIRRYTRKRWNAIREYLVERRVPFEYAVASEYGSAEELAVRFVKRGFRTIVIVGGDGAVNDVVNGIMKSDIKDKTQIHLGIIPNGIGNDFDLLTSSDYIVLGGEYGRESILARLSERSLTWSSVPFWPDDGYKGEALPKQMLYTRNSKVFSNGDKIFYASGEGRYFSILNISGDPVSESFIYDEYPSYSVGPDGLNPKRDPESKLGGIACATDSAIYIGLLNCLHTPAGYVPDNYKGYPPYYIDEIEVYGWNGEYLCTYTLDTPFATFFVSGRYLYTVTVDRDTMLSEIYRYDLPQEAWLIDHIDG